MAARAVVTAAADSLRTEVGLGERTVVVDEPERLGGTDSAPTPMELLVASLASCIAITLRMYVRRKGWELGEVGVEVCLDRDDRPHCATVTLRLPEGLDPERAQRLRQVARACPVHRTLEHGLTFEHAEAGAPA